MKNLYPVFAILICLSSPLARGDTFSGEPRTIGMDHAVVFRGVINPATVPVPDEIELDATQTGYFLFTPEAITVLGEDPGGDPVHVKDQSLFHLIVPENLKGQLEGLLGKPVEVKASVMAAHTRYHRTPIVLELTSIRGIGK